MVVLTPGSASKRPGPATRGSGIDRRNQLGGTDERTSQRRDKRGAAHFRAAQDPENDLQTGAPPAQRPDRAGQDRDQAQGHRSLASPPRSSRWPWSFVAFLVIGLIVAAIMGLATIMPAWLAALLVCGVFLLIALIAGLVGTPEIQEGHAAHARRHHPRPQARSRRRQGRLRVRRRRSWTPSPRSSRPRRPPRPRPKPRRRPRRKRRRPPSPTSARRPQRRNSGAGSSSAGRTSPGSATNWTRNSTSRPRRRHCWPRPRSGCRKARTSSAARSPVSGPPPVPMPLKQACGTALEAARHPRRLERRTRVPAPQTDEGLGSPLNCNARTTTATERGNG